MTSTSTMTIAEIYDLCDERGVSPTDFWSHAMGGDRADLPREDVERCMREIERHVREEERHMREEEEYEDRVADLMDGHGVGRAYAIAILGEWDPASEV
jgi:hypothetical protein